MSSYQQKSQIYSVWIEENSYYNLLGAYHYVKDITETEETTKVIADMKGIKVRHSPASPSQLLCT
jgi:hypothetical protein